MHVNLPDLGGRCHPLVTTERGTSSGTIKLRSPGDRAGAAWGRRWGGLIYGCASILISSNIIILLLLLLSLLRRREISLSGPCWLWELGVGGDVVTYSAQLCDNSTQGAFGNIWTRIEVIWDFEGRHCCPVIYSALLHVATAMPQLANITVGLPVKLHFKGPVISP